MDTNKQTDKQTNKPNLYIDVTIKLKLSLIDDFLWKKFTIKIPWLIKYIIVSLLLNIIVSLLLIIQAILVQSGVSTLRKRKCKQKNVSNTPSNF